MSKRIIVIDDSKTVRDEVRLTLEGAGYEVVEAANGQDGLSMILDATDLSMAICDVNMPVLNGIGMLEALQSKGLTNQLPIIMLTTEGLPALIQKAKFAGARGWIVKPFKAEHLIAVATKLAGAPA